MISIKLTEMECKFRFQFRLLQLYCNSKFNCIFSPSQPNLVDAYLKSPVPVSGMHASIIDALTAVALDLKEKPDAEQDNIERLAVIGRVLQMFSLDELKSLWQEVKDKDFVVV